MPTVADKNKADAKAAASRKAENKALTQDADRRLRALDRSARAKARGQKGGATFGVLLFVVCLGGFGWGWFHSSTAPNGATLLAVLIVAAAVLIIGTFGHLYRRSEQRGRARTKRMEDRLQQDTTGDHIWDA